MSEAGQDWRSQELGDLSVGSSSAAVDTAEIWFADLREFGALLSNPTDLARLADDDQHRAARMSAPAVREDFLLSRMLLRRVLGARCNLQGERLALVVNEHGKPALEGHAAGSPGVPVSCQSQVQPGPHFNLSHCRGAWLLGVSHTAPIGVDLERPRRIDHALRLASRVFTATEQAALLAASRAADEGRADADDHADAHFLRCWTRKEAVLKALGSGFAWPASEIEVSTSASPLRVALPRAACGEARVASLDLPVPGFAAWALLGGGDFPPLRCYRLQP